MAHHVITIAREKGSGGYDIAKRLSEKLSIPFYDRKLLRIASDVSGINEQLFGEVDERLGKHEMLRAAQKVYTGEVLPPDSDNYTSQQNLFQFQAKIIAELAETSSCIIVGRCADQILKGKPYLLRTFVHAPIEARIQRVATYSLAWTEAEIRKYICDEDKNRADYYRFYTGEDWRDAGHFDISLDSAALGEEGCADRIIQALPIFTHE
ncbi:MAG: cytidylate kinase-like family protein [Clostridiales bacterium]|nr:cytidylate kinase-like family protein [Clostridiales bacterium]